MNRRPLAISLTVFAILPSCDTLMLYSEAEMNALGVRAYAEEISKHPVIAKADRRAVMVERVGRAIAKACGRDYAWEFKLLDAPQVVNAFALPGGKIAVYSGLLEVTQTEDGLATVLGHEIAHATQSHGNKRMSQRTLAGLALGAADVVLQEWDGGSAQTKKFVNTGFALAIDGGVLKPYSRSHESEADAVGLEYMMRAGYDPEAAPALWVRMAKLGGGGQKSFLDTFLATHPDSLRRAAELRRLIPILRKKLAAENRGSASKR